MKASESEVRVFVLVIDVLGMSMLHLEDLSLGHDCRSALCKGDGFSVTETSVEIGTINLELEFFSVNAAYVIDVDADILGVFDDSVTLLLIFGGTIHGVCNELLHDLS